MSEKDTHQIIRLNYYKKLHEWRTDDEDGEGNIFNLQRNTES